MATVAATPAAPLSFPRKRLPTETQEEFRESTKTRLETVTTSIQRYLETVPDRSSDPLYVALLACVEVLVTTREHFLQPVEDPIEAEKRARSVVIENLPESTHSLASERIEHDFQQVTKILDIADLEIRPDTVFRMGEKKDGKPRLLKVLLPRASSQRVLLRLAKKVTDTREYSNVRLRPSLSAKERSTQFDLRTKKRELNAKGGDYVIYAGNLMKKGEVASFKASQPKVRPNTPSLLSVNLPAFSFTNNGRVGN